MIDMGIIEKRVSDWCSGIVIVPKDKALEMDDSNVRFCVDYRRVN